MLLEFTREVIVKRAHTGEARSRLQVALSGHAELRVQWPVIHVLYAACECAYHDELFGIREAILTRDSRGQR